MPTTIVIPITKTVTAGSDISVPTKTNIRKLIAAYKFLGSDGTAAAAHSALTLVTGGFITTTAPAAGELALFGKKTVRCGDALDSKNSLIIQVEHEFETLRYKA